MRSFKGAAKKLTDIDLPRIGSRIGVGEDEIHAVLDVEAAGSGFDSTGRPKMLFEPHVFYRCLPESKRDRACSEGLAYPKWKRGQYPSDSYPRLTRAMEIDETAALKAASWGLGQILGENHKAAGYPTVQQMVESFQESEARQLEGMIAFIKTNKLDDNLRAHDWAGFARGYNGPAYAEHGYDRKLEAAFLKWKGIKDTPWDGKDEPPKLPPDAELPPTKPPAKPKPPIPEPVKQGGIAALLLAIGSALSWFFGNIFPLLLVAIIGVSVGAIIWKARKNRRQ